MPPSTTSYVSCFFSIIVSLLKEKINPACKLYEYCVKKERD
nr:MAG TPA: hypothetical protein [Caudoviricetes sp.]